MSKEELLTRFISWTRIKIKIQLKEHKLFFNEREIWWCSLGANIGCEQDGKNEMFERPVLIFKKFNHDICWAMPLTSQDRIGKILLSIPA